MLYGYEVHLPQNQIIDVYIVNIYLIFNSKYLFGIHDVQLIMLKMIEYVIPGDRQETRGAAQNKSMLNIHNRVTMVPAIGQGHT